MSLKKVEQVKADKGFKIWDLIIYGTVIALVAVLFIVFFTTRNTDQLTGVKIYVKGEVVFEYEFGATPQILSDGVEITPDGKGLTVRITAENGDFNELYIDTSQKTVKMTDANCRGRDCLYSRTMTSNGSLPISCDPNGVRVEPFYRDLSGNDIII